MAILKLAMLPHRKREGSCLRRSRLHLRRRRPLLTTDPLLLLSYLLVLASSSVAHGTSPTLSPLPTSSVLCGTPLDLSPQNSAEDQAEASAAVSAHAEQDTQAVPDWNGEPSVQTRPASAAEENILSSVSASSSAVSGASLYAADKVPSPVSPPARARRSLLSDNSTPQCQSPAQDPHAPLTWEPRPGKYLIMFCFRNQISNLIRCMHNHVLVAALLNRTLVVPDWILFSDRNLVFPPAWEPQDSPQHLKFDLRVLWDRAHMNRCLGPRHVVTMEEFSADPAHPGPIKVNLIHCWFGHQVYCGFHNEAEPNCPARVVPLDPTGTTAGFIPDPDYFARRFPFLDMDFLQNQTRANASCMPHAVAVDAFLKEYTTPGSAAFDAPILMVGELVNMRFEDAGGRLFPKGRWGHDPFARVPGCASRLLIQPAQALMDQAKELARDFFGGFQFVAVHWRRGDFIWYCDQIVGETARGRCTYTAPQAALCVAALLQAHGISRVFMATNAASREVIHFRRSLAQAMGGNVSIYHHVHLAPGLHSLRALGEQGIKVEEQRSLIGVTVDKILCALGKVFVGSRESTFTQDIQRLRVGQGTDSTCDTLVCQGESEWDDKRVLQATQAVEFF